MGGVNQLIAKAAGDYFEADLRASVGKYGIPKKECYNTTSDQEMVRTLLNAVPVRYGGRLGGKKLEGPLTWGIVRKDLYAAIIEFQKNEYNRAEGIILDGHVDPHEKTIKRLLALRNWQPPQPTQTEIHPPQFKAEVDLPGPDPTNDPNTVFAGHRFRMKMLHGASGGLIITGHIWLSFKIWDVDNKRAALYSYQTNTLSVSELPITASYTTEGDWSDEFSTDPKWIQVDMFACESARLASASLVGNLPSVIAFTFGGNEFWGGLKVVKVPSGFTAGIPGVDIGSPAGGRLTLVPHSVTVFNGS
jgi:hypothetical protein